MTDDHEEEAPVAPLPVIKNVVATLDLGVAINLIQLRQSGYQQIEWSNNDFTKVATLRFPGTSTNGRIFRTGKMMCLGSNTDEGAKLAAQTCTLMLKEMGYPKATFGAFKIINVLAKWELEFRIHLTELKAELGNDHCTYEEQRPRVLHFKMREPRVSMNIFEKGTITLLGATSDQDVFAACELVYPVLLKYRKQQ